jgi:hypothetical protein
MDVANRGPARDMARDGRNLGVQRLQIAVDRLILPSDLDITAAKPARRIAVRHMRVERKSRVVGQCLQPVVETPALIPSWKWGAVGELV